MKLTAQTVCEPFKVCSHVTLASPCPLNLLSKFNIMLIVMDTLTGKMGCTPILSKCLSERSTVPLTKTVMWTVRVNEVLRSVYTYCFCPHLCQIYTDRQNGFWTQSVKWSITIGTMLNFDADFDGHGHGDGTCKQAFNVEWHKVVGNGANPVSSSSSSHFFHSLHHITVITHFFQVLQLL